MTAVLSARQINALIGGCPPLIDGYLNLEGQLQPAGFDLSIREVNIYTSAGKVTIDNSGRRISDLERLDFDCDGMVYLPAGTYLVTYNEVVSLPLNISALVFPRSSLLRCGVTVHTAVWDPGYCGRGQSMIDVSNPAGFEIEKNARLVQMVFYSLSEATGGYNGAYQGENIA